MFDILLIITYLLLTSFTSCLFTYFEFEPQYQTFMSPFSCISDINGFFEFQTLPFILIPPPFIKFNKNLRPPPPLQFYFDASPPSPPPFPIY